MKKREAEQLLADITPYGATRIDQTGRSLQGAGMLPKGGRGLYAPELTPHDAAMFVLGLAAANVPTEAAAKASEYAALQATFGGGSPLGPVQPYRGCGTFGEALTTMLASGEPTDVSEVEVHRDCPRVVVRLDDGSTCHYGYQDAQRHGYRPTLCTVAFVVRGSAIDRIMMELAGPAPGGWVGVPQ